MTRKIVIFTQLWSTLGRHLFERLRGGNIQEELTHEYDYQLGSRVVTILRFQSRSPRKVYTGRMSTITSGGFEPRTMSFVDEFKKRLRRGEEKVN